MDHYVSHAKLAHHILLPQRQHRPRELEEPVLLSTRLPLSVLERSSLLPVQRVGILPERQRREVLVAHEQLEDARRHVEERVREQQSLHRLRLIVTQLFCARPQSSLLLHITHVSNPHQKRLWVVQRDHAARVDRHERLHIRRHHRRVDRLLQRDRQQASPSTAHEAIASPHAPVLLSAEAESLAHRAVGDVPHGAVGVLQRHLAVRVFAEERPLLVGERSQIGDGDGVVVSAATLAAVALQTQTEQVPPPESVEAERLHESTQVGGDELSSDRAGGEVGSSAVATVTGEESGAVEERSERVLRGGAVEIVPVGGGGDGEVHVQQRGDALEPQRLQQLGELALRAVGGVGNAGVHDGEVVCVGERERDYASSARRSCWRRHRRAAPARGGGRR